MPAPDHHSERAGRLFALSAALLFSTGGAAIKATAMTSWQVAGFRSAVAAVAVLALAPAARRNWQWRVLPVGICYAATMVLFVAANKTTTSANAIFLQSTAPLYLLLAGPFLLGERIRRADIFYMLAVGLGMAAFFAGEQRHFATAPDPVTGNILAVISGVAWAGTVGGLRWLGRPRVGGEAGEAASGGARQSPGDATMATVVAGNVIAALVCLPRALPVEALSAADYYVVLYLGVFQIGLAYCCLAAALRRLPAFETSLLLLAEPALNPVWAALYHGEHPGRMALAGGALILGATLVKMALGRGSPSRAR